MIVLCSITVTQRDRPCRSAVSHFSLFLPHYEWGGIDPDSKQREREKVERERERVDNNNNY